jgi:hypothetical protein
VLHSDAVGCGWDSGPSSSYGEELVYTSSPVGLLDAVSERREVVTHIVPCRWSSTPGARGRGVVGSSRAPQVAGVVVAATAVVKTTRRKYFMFHVAGPHVLFVGLLCDRRVPDLPNPIRPPQIANGGLCSRARLIINRGITQPSEPAAAGVLRTKALC